jgi:hypothetical protein
MFKNISFYFLVLHPVVHNTSILNESTTFRNQLWVFSLLFYTALHVSAYKQAIFRCYMTNHKKVKLLSFHSVDPPSHNITIVFVYIAKCSINTPCVQGVILPHMTDPTSRQRGRPKNYKTVTFKKKKISGQMSQIWA